MIELIKLDRSYTIVKVKEEHEIPSRVYLSDFYSVTRTDEEISIITDCDTDFSNLESSSGWKGFKVKGILDFAQTGILHAIIEPLKDNGIPVFVISTFNTDYIFVKNEFFDRSTEILRESSYVIS